MKLLEGSCKVSTKIQPTFPYPEKKKQKNLHSIFSPPDSHSSLAVLKAGNMHVILTNIIYCF